MAVFNDLFNGSLGSTLQAHAADSGQSWSKHAAYASSATDYSFSVTTAVRPLASALVMYISSWAPPSTDYAVWATGVTTGSGSGATAIAARLNASADTCYTLVMQSNGVFNLTRRVAGASTTLGTWTDSVTSGATRDYKLEVKNEVVDIGGTPTNVVKLRGYVGGVQRIPATAGDWYIDSSASRILTAGSIGVRGYSDGTYVSLESMGADAIVSAATTTTLSGANSGTVGVPIALTIGINGSHAGVNITPATSGSGAFSPSGALARSTATQSDIVNYTPSAAGTHTISLSNDGGLADAAALVITVAAAGDTTAPILTSPVGSATGSTTATVGATTDEGNGTLYAVITTSSTQPSEEQIEDGQSDTGAAAAWAGSVPVTSSGAKTLNASGLAPSTTYYAHLMHPDAAGNRSNRVVSSSFTTAAAVLYGFDFDSAAGLVFGDMAGALTGLARQAGVAVEVSAYSTSTRALVAYSGTLTTDSNGRLPRWTHAALANVTQYRLVFVRLSDGEVCATLMSTT